VGHTHCNKSYRPDYLCGKVPILVGGPIHTNNDTIDWFSANIIHLFPDKDQFSLESFTYFVTEAGDKDPWKKNLQSEKTFPLINKMGGICKLTEQNVRLQSEKKKMEWLLSQYKKNSA
jgi:hypothetical protein